MQSREEATEREVKIIT